MKISKKYLQKIIKEEVQAVLLEQEDPTAEQWLGQYKKATQLVYKNRVKLGFSKTDTIADIAAFLGGKRAVGLQRSKSGILLYAYQEETPQEFLDSVAHYKKQDSAALSSKRLADMGGDSASLSRRAQDRESSRPKKIEVVLSRQGLLRGDDPLQGARRKAAEKANLTLQQYTQQYTDKVITKTEGSGPFTVDVKTLVATRKGL